MGLLRTLHFLSRFSLMLGYLLRAFAEKQAGNTAGCDECMRRAFAMLEQLEAEVRRKLDRAKAEVADAAPLACADA